jgi:hypothetical protein
MKILSIYTWMMIGFAIYFNIKDFEMTYKTIIFSMLIMICMYQLIEINHLTKEF